MYKCTETNLPLTEVLSVSVSAILYFCNFYYPQRLFSFSFISKQERNCIGHAHKLFLARVIFAEGTVALSVARLQVRSQLAFNSISPKKKTILHAWHINYYSCLWTLLDTFRKMFTKLLNGFKKFWLRLRFLWKPYSKNSLNFSQTSLGLGITKCLSLDWFMKRRDKYLSRFL